MSKLNFSTMGTFGDTVFSLCVMKIMGGGNMYVKLNALDDFARNVIGWPNAGPASGRYTQKDYEMIAPLLEAQDYIDNVAVWNGEHIDCGFEDHWKFHLIKGWQGNQTECYALAQGMNIDDPALKKKLLYDPWLTPVEPIKIPGKTIAIHRAHRYNYTPDPSPEWYDFVENNLSEQGFFLGTDKEHSDFENQFKIKIHHQKVEDFLEMARYIQGSELLVANQSMHVTIAMGLGKTFFLELRKDYQNTVTPKGVYGDNWFPRINAFYF